MNQAIQERNKALVLEAFDTLFNKRDYAAAECFWSPNYIQHSAHIAPGREGLFDLIKSMPSTLKYEPGTIVAEGDFVIVHGRFSGFGQPVNWIAADILRIEDEADRVLEVVDSLVLGGDLLVLGREGLLEFCDPCPCLLRVLHADQLCG